VDRGLFYRYFLMTHNHQSYSFSHQAWKRLKKNKGAMLGLVIIVIAILAAVFGYYIVTDPTPNADRQVVEVQARKPGYKQLFLKVRKEK